MNSLPTAKISRSIEALLEIVVKLFGIYIVYLAFNTLGQSLFADDFRQDTLLSLLLLPALYVLRESLIIIEPFFAVVSVSKDRITVKSGVTPRISDTLNLESVDNIEVVRTPIGFLCDYGSINLYGIGGTVEIPFVKNPDTVSEQIATNIQ